MASRSPKVPPTGFPEFAARRKTFDQFFDPPLPPSTFHDLVNKGRILPMKGIRGFYLLNASLSRLGLREVPSLPNDVPQRSTEDIMRLAFSVIDPLIFPEPPWMLSVEALDMRDVDHAALMVGTHREAVEALESASEKLGYLSGVLAAQTTMKAGMKPDGG